MSSLSNTCNLSGKSVSTQPSGARQLFSALMHEIRIRHAIRAASALDDCTLTDIGMNRGGIENAVRFGRR